MDSLEAALARHCAPALLGAKAANLAAVDPRQVPALHARVEQLNRQLAGCGLAFTLLCECGRRSLLLVYRPALLARRLRRDGAALARSLPTRPPATKTLPPAARWAVRWPDDFCHSSLSHRQTSSMKKPSFPACEQGRKGRPFPCGKDALR